jgi:hypothetical protein
LTREGRLLPHYLSPGEGAAVAAINRALRFTRKDGDVCIGIKKVSKLPLTFLCSAVILDEDK